MDYMCIKIAAFYSLNDVDFMETRKQKGRVSYGQRWFRMESWASRLHTARCWCTCGNGCCLSTCSRTLCGAQISTPPSPPAFYFGSIKGKRQQEGGGLMRRVEAFITAKDTDLHFSFPMMKWVDMDRDGHWPSLWPQTILLCQTESWTLLLLPIIVRANRGMSLTCWQVHTFESRHCHYEGQTK